MRVLFLGPLRDCEGVDERTLFAPLDWASLLAAVTLETAEQLAEERVHVACKGRVLTDKTALCAEDGDEVALLPPVSGG